MAVTTISSRDFALDLAQAKRATTAGPVLVLDNEKPVYALLKIDDYYELTGKSFRSLLDVMNSLPGGHEDFNPPRLTSLGLRPAEFE